MAKGVKTGGRTKNTPNKRTLQAMEIMQKHHFCPVSRGIEMFEMALSEFATDSSEFRFKYLEVAQRELADLRQYAYPKRKAVELSGPDGGAVQVAPAVDLSELSVDELRVLDKVMGDGGEAPPDKS